MKRAVSSAAVLALGALALVGCSGGNQPAAVATGAGAADLPSITARGLETVTGTPDTVTVILGVQTRGQTPRAPLMRTTERRPR
jgi:uncharacterized protein YggE